MAVKGKRSKDIQKVRRHLRILTMMTITRKTNRDVYNKLLHEGFEIADIKTVQVDMKELRNDFPFLIESKKDANGSFTYRKPIHNTIDKRKDSAMSPREAVCFQIAFQHLTPLLPSRSLDDLAPYLKEAEAVLSDNSSKKMKNWKDKVMTINEGLQLQQAKVNASVLNNIHMALWDEKVVKASYASKNKPFPSQYIIHPAGLVYRGRICYLVCSFEDDNEKIIYLPLHRFKSIEIIEDSYSRHRKHKIQNLAKDLLGFKLNEEKINISLKFSEFAGSHLFETPLSHSQKIKRTRDGYLIVEDKVVDNMELRYWIRAFGDSVEVLKPSKLRKEFAKEAKRIMKKYEKD